MWQKQASMFSGVFLIWKGWEVFLKSKTGMQNRVCYYIIESYLLLAWGMLEEFFKLFLQ